MKNAKKTAWYCAALALAAGWLQPPVAAAAAQLFGIGSNGLLWDIDKTAGTASNARATGVTTPADLAAGLDGRLYSINTGLGGLGSYKLHRIDPITGAGTVAATTGLISSVEGGLTSSPSGTLFGSYQINGAIKSLYTVNPATGHTTILGDTAGSDDVSALAFGTDGTLYAIDSMVNAGGVAQLYTLNPSNGAIVTTTPLSLDFDGGTLGAAVDPDTGTFYVASGGTDTLYTLNVATGNLTAVGPLGAFNDAVGIAFVSVPEPGATAALLVVGAVGMLRRRHR